jgi:predicted ArsR family transcriptional regulator
MGSTRHRILELIKLNGPLTPSELAGHLCITAVAVRQHLQIMYEEGLLESSEDKRSLGRPARRWELTERAQAHFPDEHRRLALDLIGAMDRVLKREDFEAVMNEHAMQLRERYMAEMPESDASLGDCVNALTALRSKDGHMARLEEKEEGVWLLTQHHCPICPSTRACPRICESEPELLEAALRGRATVKRTEFVHEGARHCTYEIRANHTS